MAGKEARLQAECVRWYRNDWFKNPKMLFAVFNEGLNVSGKISMGLVPGVSDLLYYEKDGRKLIGIELKFPGESHDIQHVIRQCKFIIDVCDSGGFCDNLEQFKQLIQGGSTLYDPQKVLAYLESLKTKSFVWNSEKFI
jgi:hypothetical protein